MEQGKSFQEWRAGKLGYVYFSRLNDLIIDESNSNEGLFDYLIDIGKDNKQTGRLFGVEVKSLTESSRLDLPFFERFKNITFPILLVNFDTQTDHSYFTWIKMPGDNGNLTFDSSKATMNDLNDESLKEIVTTIQNWYDHRQVT